MNELLMESDLLMEMVGKFYDEELPFNRFVGMRTSFVTPDAAGMCIEMKPALVGNIAFNILHGGAISAILDATGGLTATAAAVAKMAPATQNAVYQRMTRVGTIDMRVDYLRPGKGESFSSRGSVMRIGRRVAVIRMELQNQSKTLIAVGTGAYSI